MRASHFVTILLLLSAPAAADNAVGVNVHLPADDELDACADLGVGWIRIDNNWLVVEPRDGRYEWRELDRVVDGARARGLEVFMTLAYAPGWASERDADGVPTNNVPRAGLYERYVEATVARYRDRVTHYGIWNEPNLDGFWEGTLDQYVDRILRPGAAAVRRACPACRVVGPDLAGVGGWQDYLTGVLRRAGDQIDIVSHHSYATFQRVRAQWICDDFPHAIDNSDQPVICGYKPGLRQVLDAAGWDGEVWMTEVGRRADPWDDARLQRHQVETAQDILALQLATPWWTTTFFYELTDCRPAQPDCPIDGYGLLRRVAGPDGTWADNFVLKPVYLWLRGELARNPAWRPGFEPPPPDPAPLRIEAPRREAGAPDGRIDEWDERGCVVLQRYEVLISPPSGPADLQARACAAWSPDALWLAVEVTDDVHDNSHRDDQLWQGDSVQLALDVNADAVAGAGYDDDDRELALALVDGETRLFAHHGALDGVTGAVRREGRRTLYELRVALPGLAEGRALRASFLVNDADGGGREGWLEWTPGIGHEKRPAQFGELALVDRAAEPMPDPEPDADAGRPRPPLPEPPDVGADPLDAVAATDASATDASPTDGRASGDGGSLVDGGMVPRRPAPDAGGVAPSSSGDCRVARGGTPPWLLLWALLLGLGRRGVRRRAAGRRRTLAP